VSRVLGEIFMNIGKQLKLIRTDRGLTQKEIANAVNITEASYQRYEYGTVSPGLDKLIALANFFDVSLDYLVGRSDVAERH